jgi:hypothetical protein
VSVREERIKQFATALNNVGVGAILAGVIGRSSAGTATRSRLSYGSVVART